jgi:hypothetical protein
MWTSFKLRTSTRILSSQGSILQDVGFIIKSHFYILVTQHNISCACNFNATNIIVQEDFDFKDYI